MSEHERKKITYKYKFTCEYTRVTSRPFEEIIEYDDEPSEDELDADYNAWLLQYVAGGWERDEDDGE